MNKKLSEYTIEFDAQGGSSVLGRHTMKQCPKLGLRYLPNNKGECMKSSPS